MVVHHLFETQYWTGVRIPPPPPLNNTMLKRVIVYTKEDYSDFDSIWVSEDLSKEEITEKVNKQFEVWFYYDII